MKRAAPCLYEDRDGVCGQAKNGRRHYGHEADHEYQGEPKSGFGSQRRQLNRRSEKREDYMREKRRPAVAKAVGDGRRPCQVKAPGCTNYVDSIHETASRGRFGGLESSVEAGPTVDACNSCNRWCSEHPIEAQERGLMRSNTLTGKRHTPRGPVPRRGRFQDG